MAGRGLRRRRAVRVPLSWKLTDAAFIISFFLYLNRGALVMGILSQNGISHTAEREKNDYYATDPRAMRELLKFETFAANIWEPACGEGNLSEELKKAGYNVYSTDLIDRGYQDQTLDFLSSKMIFNGDIVTNPPFKYTTEFIKKGLESLRPGAKMAFFLKLNYLSGKKRYKEIYKNYPPQRVYVFTGRRACSKNNNPEGFKKNNGMDFCWMVWEKGQYSPPELKWIDIDAAA